MDSRLYMQSILTTCKRIQAILESADVDKEELIRPYLKDADEILGDLEDELAETRV